MLPSLRKFTGSEAAQERLKIIQVYDELGEAGSIKYYRVNRKTIHVWKKKLAHSGNRLESLIPRSTRPEHTRRMQTDPRIVAFLRQLREAHPHLGKEKLKPLLDAHCRTIGIPSLANSTIGKVIKRYRLQGAKGGRAYHDPGSHFAQKNRGPSKKRQRVRYAPKPQELGHLQMDTMHRLVDGL